MAATVQRSNGGLTQSVGVSKQSAARTMRPLSLSIQHQLILGSKGKATSLAYKLLRLWGASLERDEVTSAVDLALCLAAKRFNPALKVDFLTFAFYALRGGLIQTIRSRVACREQTFGLVQGEAVKDPFESNDQDEDCITRELVAESDPVNTPEHQYYLAELKKRCHQALGSLSQIEKKVIFLADFKDLKITAAAKKMGYSRGHVSMMRSKALRKMRRQLWMYDQAA